MTETGIMRTEVRDFEGPEKMEVLSYGGKSLLWGG